MFFGENMRGKTTLLNAIRFALFGVIMGRGQRDGSLHQTGNWDADAPGFEVQLDLIHNDRKFRLTRTCKPKPGIVKPAHDQDYTVTYYLERDGHVLGPQDSADELQRIMPKEIMRFFLFDGELLQQYEDLLHTESKLGLTISQAIEQILGLPVLTGARSTLQSVRERARGTSSPGRAGGPEDAAIRHGTAGAPGSGEDAHRRSGALRSRARRPEDEKNRRSKRRSGSGR